jgi:hypothetical protein
VRAEADQPDGHQRDQAQPGAGGDPPALPPARYRERHERQQKPRADLDAHADHERHRGGSEAGARPGRQRQGGSDHQHHQRVVVGAAHGQLEQHRVQSHEGRRPASRLAEAPGGPCDERDRPEAGAHRNDLERPQAPGDAQGCGAVAGEAEQGPVGGALEGPADEREDGVGEDFRGDVRVGVQAVKAAHAREGEIAKDILGHQRRADEQDQLGRHDARGQQPPGQRAGGEQHDQVARAHDQRERLEALLGEAHLDTAKRPGQPVRPAAGAGRDVHRGSRRGAGADQEHAAQHAEQARCTDRGQQARPGPCAVGRFGRRRGDSCSGYWGCRLDRPIVTSAGPASMLRAR